MQEYASTSQPPLSKTSCHDSKSFSKPPPQNPTCKSMPQPHSFTSPRLLVTIPSHFLNLPLKSPTCKSIPQLHSLPSPRLLVTIPNHFLNLPPPKPYMQEYASTSQLHLSKPSCHDSKSFFKPPPQNPTCKSMPQPHSFTSPRLLVTIPSHFLNLPPKTLHARVFLNFTASPIQDFLLDSKSFFKPPPQNPTCKTMPQLHRLPPPRVLVTIPSHLLNLPPQNPACKSMPQLHSFTSPRLRVTIPRHVLNLPPKTLHARVSKEKKACG